MNICVPLKKWRLLKGGKASVEREALTAEQMEVDTSGDGRIIL